MNHIVLLDYFSAVIAENWKAEVVLFHEGFVGPRIIDVDSDDLSVELVELGEIVPSCAHFLGAYAREGTWNEG